MCFVCLQVKDERKAQEVFDLADYERSEELRKAKSRSKKNHSRFTLLRCRQPGNTVSGSIQKEKQVSPAIYILYYFVLSQ